MVNIYKKMWHGICNISQMIATENLKTGRNEQNEETLFEEVPCLLVEYSRSSSKEKICEVNTSAKLFIDNDVLVPEGAKIKVTQHGRTGDYAYSGKPKVYEHHQEIPIILLKRWA